MSQYKEDWEIIGKVWFFNWFWGFDGWLWQKNWQDSLLTLNFLTSTFSQLSMKIKQFLKTKSSRKKLFNILASPSAMTYCQGDVITANLFIIT